MTYLPVASPQAAILFEGNPTGLIIHRVVLEAAIKIDSLRYLLFVTDDVIFEEMLPLMLLNLSQGIPLRSAVPILTFPSETINNDLLSDDGNKLP